MELHKVERVGSDFKIIYKKTIDDLNGNPVEVPTDVDIRSRDEILQTIEAFQRRKTDAEYHMARLKAELAAIDALTV
jgi:hypothetical protein